MRFSIEQHYDEDPASVLDAFTDADMYPTFTGLTRVATPEVLERSVEKDRIFMRIKMRFAASLSPAAKRIIDPGKLTWVQREEYDLAAHTAKVVFLPDNYADRFSCVGKYTFASTVSGGTVRNIDGNLKIRMPLVGGEVERAIISGLRDHFSQEQPLVKAWLQG